MTLMTVKMEKLDELVKLAARIMVRRPEDDNDDIVAQLTQLVEDAQQHLETMHLGRLELPEFASECLDAQPMQCLAWHMCTSAPLWCL